MRLRIITDHDGPDGTRVVFSTESGVEVTFIPQDTSDRDPAALLDCELPTLHSISLLDQITHVGGYDPDPHDPTDRKDPTMTEPTTTEAEFDAARYKADHLAACELVAAMHKAAVGETRGPIRGVVEDVADVRAALDRAREWFSGQDHPGLTGGELVDLAAALRTP